MQESNTMWLLHKHAQFQIYHRWGFLSNLRLPWKTELALKIFTALNILFTLKIFEQLALSLKNRVCPEFTVMNTFFTIHDFWATLCLPWKTEFRVCSEIFHWIVYTFYIQNILATCACPETQSVPWSHCIQYIFYHSGFFSNLRLPWKESLPWKFSRLGDVASRQPTSCAYAYDCHLQPSVIHIIINKFCRVIPWWVIFEIHRINLIANGTSPSNLQKAV